MKRLIWILMVIALVIVGYETFFRPTVPFPASAFVPPHSTASALIDFA